MSTPIRMSHAVCVRDLRKTFESSFTLGPVTLSIPRGTVCALVGPNGAGKTTLMNLLMGVGRADDGSATVLGHEVGGDTAIEVKRQAAYVSMDISYAGWGTVSRAIRFVSGFYSDWSSERCDRLLEQFGIDRSARVATLSFGSRVKLALVMALSREAQLLLLDEPTAGLDPLARQQLFSQLLHFMQNENRTIVISSHQISDLERFADHVVVMQAGQVVAAGAIPDLLDRYVQLDVRLPSRGVLGHVPLSVIARDENRARVLLDQQSPHQDTLARLGVEVLGRSSLTLEELFVALMRAGKTAWQPDTSAG